MLARRLCRNFLSWWARHLPLAAVAGLLLLALGAAAAFAGAEEGVPVDLLRREDWPHTDFAKTTVDLAEIRWGGVPKDGIRSIDESGFVALAEARAAGLSERDPVIGLVLNGEERAYPLSVLVRHEIVNDVVGGIPVAVTYCPLCNTALVFDRRSGDRVLEFGVSGFLRNSDLVMYDRQTESWWQQFTGEGIVGELAGTLLTPLPVRLESFASFGTRAPKGMVLDPPLGLARYGSNPYVGYDSRSAPTASTTGLSPTRSRPSRGSCGWARRRGASTWSAPRVGSRAATSSSPGNPAKPRRSIRRSSPRAPRSATFACSAAPERLRGHRLLGRLRLCLPRLLPGRHGPHQIAALAYSFSALGCRL